MAKDRSGFVFAATAFGVLFWCVGPVLIGTGIATAVAASVVAWLAGAAGMAVVAVAIFALGVVVWRRRTGRREDHRS